MPVLVLQDHGRTVYSVAWETEKPGVMQDDWDPSRVDPFDRE